MVSCEMTERPSAGCGAEDSGDLLPAELGVPQEAAEPLTAQSPMPWASLGLDDYQDAPEPGTESWQVPGEPSAELPLELWDDTEQFPDEEFPTLPSGPAFFGVTVRDWNLATLARRAALAAAAAMSCAYVVKALVFVGGGDRGLTLVIRLTLWLILSVLPLFSLLLGLCLNQRLLLVGFVIGMGFWLADAVLGVVVNAVFVVGGSKWLVGSMVLQCISGVLIWVAVFYGMKVMQCIAAERRELRMGHGGSSSSSSAFASSSSETSSDSSSAR